MKNFPLNSHSAPFLTAVNLASFASGSFFPYMGFGSEIQYFKAKFFIPNCSPNIYSQTIFPELLGEKRPVKKEIKAEEASIICPFLNSSGQVSVTVNPYCAL